MGAALIQKPASPGGQIRTNGKPSFSALRGVQGRTATAAVELALGEGRGAAGLSQWQRSSARVASALVRVTA
jgi:hypothetical protein